MKNISYKIGYWSAISLTVFFVIWIVCFVRIAVGSPLFFWNGLSHYLSYISTYDQWFADVAKVAMLFFGPAYLLLIHSFYECSSYAQKPFVRISLLFALAFMITSCIHYFVQLTSVKFCLKNDLTIGIENFLQANPYSFTIAVNMLGWTIFLGFSSLFMYFAFRIDHLNKNLKLYFCLLSVCCLFATVGYCFQIKWIIFLFVNLGIGGAFLMISITSRKFFKTC